MSEANHRAPASRGVLVLVAGPSGSGKDTLLNGARAALAGRDDIVFATRIITRAPDATEAHTPISQDAFVAELARGAFALHWASHGLDYALPASIEAQLAAGCTVVANVSRTVIASARAALAPVRVILIDAPADVRLARLRRRGREAASDIEGRVARAVSEVTLGPGDTHIDNSGAPEAGVAQLIAAIEAATRAGRP